MEVDLEAIEKHLNECEEEIKERIAEIEEGQIINQEVLQLEFGI